MPNDRVAEARSAPPEQTGAARQTAFVIDDDPLMAKVLGRHLTRRGIEPVSFDDPTLLLDSLRGAPAPAFLFSDLEMPRMNGATLIARAREAGYSGRIVLVTASRDHEALCAAAAAGADEILAKPVKDIDLDMILVKARAQRRSAPLELLRAAIEPVEQGIILVDDEGVPLTANARAREILRAESLADVVRAFEQCGLAAEVMEERGEAGEISFVDLSAGEGGGSPLPIGFKVHRLACAASGVIRVVLLHDFSGWRKLDELHSRLVTMLSHRMRTPLTAVRNAVSILEGSERPLDAAEKERFLDIGCRNLEKLISSFDELQRIFMVDAGEIASCRSLFRAQRELQAILDECASVGKVSGFRLRSPDIAILTCRRRLREYVSDAVDAIALWSGGAPYIECAASVPEAPDAGGGAGPVFSLSLVPRAAMGADGVGLREYLRRREGQKELILEKLARSLGGVHETTVRNTMRLAIPLEPAFDRERDLVHPLHMMIEKAELEKVEFHLVSVRLAGEASDARRCARFLETSLCGAFPRDTVLVSRGEEPASFAVFAAGVPRARVDETMEALRDHFARFCRGSAEEIYPAIRWEITYSREPGSPGAEGTCSLLDFSAKS